MHQKTKLPNTPDKDICASDDSACTIFNISGLIADSLSSRPVNPPTAFNDRITNTTDITSIGSPCAKSVHATDFKPPTIT